MKFWLNRLSVLAKINQNISPMATRLDNVFFIMYYIRSMQGHQIDITLTGHMVFRFILTSRLCLWINYTLSLRGLKKETSKNFKFYILLSIHFFYCNMFRVFGSFSEFKLQNYSTTIFCIFTSFSAFVVLSK